MALGPVTGELRAVPAAPPDRRFSHPGISARLMATPRTDSTFRAREQRMPAQVADNLLVAYRQAHGVLPSWVYEHATRRAEHGVCVRPIGPTQPVSLSSCISGEGWCWFCYCAHG